MMFLFIPFMLLIIGNGELYNKKGKERAEQITNLLFPNRTHHYFEQTNLRSLGIVKDPYDGNAECTICTGLSVCTILNGFLIEEVYNTKKKYLMETCHVIDSLGERMESEIFGNGKTFRDTPQCREIVMQYLCLFYGSNNPMYTNYCVNQEATPPSLPKTMWQLAQRPPCKSFCVQVATVCANERDFIQTCDEIACPQLDNECIADPQIDGVPMKANLGCSVPYYDDPYASSASSSKLSVIVTMLCITISVFWLSS